MFIPYVLDWDSMKFENCLAALKAFQTGNVMKIIKTWLNGWATSSRSQATHIYPCVFGCHGVRDDLHHYFVCPRLFAICKFLKIDLSIFQLKDLD